jgi:acetyl-CoA carboxylase biotin carboxyl carrier protein
MDLKDLKSLIKMITETDITEFEMESAGEKIRLQRGNVSETAGYAMVPPMMVPQLVSQPAPATSFSDRQGTLEASADIADNATSITSPIVGTMYRAPSPDAPPYVEVGQVVEKGQVLCIVEAMKLMNEIEAEIRCKIVKICKENAQPVEFGDVLFVVEPL